MPSTAEIWNGSCTGARPEARTSILPAPRTPISREPPAKSRSSGWFSPAATVQSGPESTGPAGVWGWLEASRQGGSAVGEGELPETGTGDDLEEAGPGAAPPEQAPESRTTAASQASQFRPRPSRLQPRVSTSSFIRR